MSVYPRTEEENIRDSRLVGEWIHSGLLQESQRSVLDQSLASNLRTIHVVFRILLFIFSALIVVAVAGLAVVQMPVREDSLFGVLLGLCALASFGIAWFLAKDVRLYRCGAEEAAAVLSVIFSGMGMVLILEPNRGSALHFVAAFAFASAASFVVYAQFGFRYMGVAGVILAGVAPFMLDTDISTRRWLSALIFAGFFFAARRRATAARYQLSGPDYAWMQAFAWGGIYLTLHQKLPSLGIAGGTGLFYWWTYLMIWILPAIGIWLGVRDRDRILLDVSAVMALVTLISNKPYLGWTRQAWDPILLGLLLIGMAAFLRRLLTAGVKGERGGFTADRLVGREHRYIEAASVVSFAVQQPDVQLPKSDSGGRSGGAGVSGNF